MRIGIFFGGASREREISFAGGRTVYDNLNKGLFTPVPVFVDPRGHFILLDWQYLYKGTIRDFYPPAASLPANLGPYQIYAESLAHLTEQEWQAMMQQVGQPIAPHEFAQHFDFAFLALHGPWGEDGNIQGLLEWYGIPYSGSGILPSALGISKSAQQPWLKAHGFARPASQVLSRQQWKQAQQAGALPQVFEQLKAQIGLPMVIKAPHQGSSIGVALLHQNSLQDFSHAIEKCFFTQAVSATFWKGLNAAARHNWLTNLTDLRHGLGLPVVLQGTTYYTPLQLAQGLDTLLEQQEQVLLESPHGEAEVLIEGFIEGQEFSCIVIENENGQPIALPPTQIIKQQQVFDYRAKYLPGISRKITPIDLPEAQIENICQQCQGLFAAMGAQVYARIDGFINDQGQVFLNDPNTTSGMLPSSFFFHQAAEIGLDPSQFLTYIVRTSLAARTRQGKNTLALSTQLQQLDQAIAQASQAATQKMPVAVIMGGYSTERHISVESGRNIYEKLSASERYLPLPVFLTGPANAYRMFTLPVNMMLKDNADDITEKIAALQQKPQVHPVVARIQQAAAALTQKYAGPSQRRVQQLDFAALAQQVQAVFIALHGRPGEDGDLQQHLEAVGLPYNGSGVASSQTTINKYNTNELLAQHGIHVAQHRMVSQQEWQSPETLASIEQNFGYPLIAKPADDGCSSAVKKINNRQELQAFAQLMFRPQPGLDPAPCQVLDLKPSEEFPQKQAFLIESLIEKGQATHFLEITGGLLTHHEPNGGIRYEMFEPSEALASKGVLSLEEKFLAGEGQNITPARYAPTPQESQRISQLVRQELEKTARLLNVEGYARIDAFVKVMPNGQVQTWVIEVNSLPGMTPATAIFHQCALNGYKPYDFIDAILQYGIAKRLPNTTKA